MLARELVQLHHAGLLALLASAAAGETGVSPLGLRGRDAVDASLADHGDDRRAAGDFGLVGDGGLGG